MDPKPVLRALSRADVGTSRDVERVRVELPTLGAFAFVCELGADARDDFDLSLAEVRDAERAAGRNPLRAVARAMRLSLLRLCVETETPGETLFADEGAVETFTKNNGKAARALYERAMEVNGFGKKNSEKAEGESAGAPSADSPSA